MGAQYNYLNHAEAKRLGELEQKYDDAVKACKSGFGDVSACFVKADADLRKADNANTVHLAAACSGGNSSLCQSLTVEMRNSIALTKQHIDAANSSLTVADLNNIAANATIDRISTARGELAQQQTAAQKLESQRLEQLEKEKAKEDAITRGTAGFGLALDEGYNGDPEHDKYIDQFKAFTKEQPYDQATAIVFDSSMLSGIGTKPIQEGDIVDSQGKGSYVIIGRTADGKPIGRPATQAEIDTAKVMTRNDLSGIALTSAINGTMAAVGGVAALESKVGATKFGNKLPNDPIDTAKIIPNNQLSNISGTFNYVVAEDGTLIVGKSAHTSLTGGAPVTAAGEVKIVNGKVISIDNASGHLICPRFDGHLLT